MTEQQQIQPIDILEAAYLEMSKATQTPANYLLIEAAAHNQFNLIRAQLAELAELKADKGKKAE